MILEFSSRRRGLLLAIALAGLLLRLWFLYAVPLEPVADFRRYFEVAQSVANGMGFRISGVPYISQAPMYPGILGAWFTLTGGTVPAGKLLNLLLWIAIFALWGWLGWRAGMRGAWHVSTMALLAFHPALVAYTNVLGTETLAIFLSTLMIALALVERRWASVLLGVILAMAALNRPQLLPLPLVVLFALMLGNMNRSRAMSRSVLIALGFIVALSPWVVRNAIVFERAVPVSANSGYVLMVNNNSVNERGAWMPLRDVPLSEANRDAFSGVGFPPEFFSGDDENWKLRHWTPGADTVATGIGKQWIVSHPRRFVELAWLRVQGSFDPVGLMHWPFLERGGTPPWLIKTAWLGTFCVVGLFFIGVTRMLLSLRQPDLALSLALGIIALGMISIVVFEGQGRYLLPMLPAALYVGATQMGSGCRRDWFRQVRKIDARPEATPVKIQRSASGRSRPSTD